MKSNLKSVSDYRYISKHLQFEAIVENGYGKVTHGEGGPGSDGATAGFRKTS